jgi:TatA/E family protein of Tat protein translocase
MFGVSIQELIVVFAVALIVFGPDKLPELARLLGKISGELKRNADSIRREFYNAVYEPSPEIKERLEYQLRNLVPSISDSATYQSNNENLAPTENSTITEDPTIITEQSSVPNQNQTNVPEQNHTDSALDQKKYE